LSLLRAPIWMTCTEYGPGENVSVVPDSVSDDSWTSADPSPVRAASSCGMP
jgi:hypothetical protein